METELASEMLCFKKLAHGHSPKKKKKIVTVKFSNVMFSLLSANDDLLMRSLVWLYMV